MEAEGVGVDRLAHVGDAVGAQDVECEGAQAGEDAWAGADLLPPTVLKPKTVVYVRQSTPAQVETNLESRRWQYELSRALALVPQACYPAVQVQDNDCGDDELKSYG